MGALHILLCIWASRQPCRSFWTNTWVAGQEVVRIMDHCSTGPLSTCTKLLECPALFVCLVATIDCHARNIALQFCSCVMCHCKIVAAPFTEAFYLAAASAVAVCSASQPLRGAGWTVTYTLCGFLPGCGIRLYESFKACVWQIPGGTNAFMPSGAAPVACTAMHHAAQRLHPEKLISVGEC